MDVQRFKGCEGELFREVFEGKHPESSGTWFVEKTEAIFDAVRSLSAEQASFVVPGQLASIGAHVWHLHYYLWLFNANHRGESPKADWEGSWRTQQFTDREWTDMGARLMLDYQEARGWYANSAGMDDETCTSSIANIAHAAYHLGAIRALLPIVQHAV